MSEEQLKEFIAKAKDDQSIQDKLKAAKSPEDVMAIAKEHGHEFTSDTKISELSDDELEGLAGGHESPLLAWKACLAGGAATWLEATN